jgi:uncharacterized protein YxjI
LSNLIINAKIFSPGGEFWVTDDAGNPRYQVIGSFLRIPKEFRIYDVQGRELARVTHTIVSLLPRFTLEIGGQQVAVIQKKPSFFQPKYSIDAYGVEVVGNIWDMNFEIQRGSAVVGRIDKQWSVRDRYRVEVLDSRDELLVLGLVLAINYVKKERARRRATQ